MVSELDTDTTRSREAEERSQYLKLLSEEYRSLSTTGNLTDHHTYTALQWGTAVVAVIASAVLTQWGKHDALVEAALLVVIPLLIGLGMLYWIGELARMKRVYDFICVVEEKAELALRVGAEERTNIGWYSQFEAQWRDEGRQRVEAKLGFVLPRAGANIIDVEAAPIQFERWLRRIRNQRASRNLSWVFMFRLAVFPVAIAGTWGAGLVLPPGPRERSTSAGTRICSGRGGRCTQCNDDMACCRASDRPKRLRRQTDAAGLESQVATPRA